MKFFRAMAAWAIALVTIFSLQAMAAPVFISPFAAEVLWATETDQNGHTVVTKPGGGSLDLGTTYSGDYTAWRFVLSGGVTELYAAAFNGSGFGPLTKVASGHYRYVNNASSAMTYRKDDYSITGFYWGVDAPVDSPVNLSEYDLSSQFAIYDPAVIGMARVDLITSGAGNQKLSFDNVVSVPENSAGGGTPAVPEPTSLLLALLALAVAAILIHRRKAA